MLLSSLYTATNDTTLMLKTIEITSILNKKIVFKNIIMSRKKKLKFKDIINSDKPVLVDFYATWCGPCKALSPVIGEVKKELGTSMRVIKIDVDKKKAVSNKYKIKTLPTLAIFQNGELLWRESGMKTKAQLLNITSRYIGNSSPTTSEENNTSKKKTSWFGKLFKKNK